MIFLGKWIANFVVLAIVSLFYHGITYSGVAAMILGALVLSLAQIIIKPILTLLTLPINILTLGLFSLVINGFIIWLMASLVPGIYLKSFGAAIIVWILSSIVGLFVGPLIQ
ncbi:phage holin family protein [Coprothermobacter platensis]|uniref:phage holin family protein n=1 Tax=Coprothermobacter platensis TaxID=108819 RepID=UPI0003635736|nr:phage holin family protein [Coprothermobacter platensis]